jgi:hypothetical protein
MSTTKADEPLGLVVHSMPAAQQATLSGGRSGSIWKLLAIVLVCSLPAIVAYFAYYVVRPAGRAGFGELIQPVRPVPAAGASALDGSPVALSSLKRQWLLLSVAGAACEPDCQRRLFTQRQLRETLGKEKERFDLVWLISDQQALPEGLRQRVADTTLLRVEQRVLNDWLLAAPDKALTDFIFVIDPMGNTMMRFPAQFDAASASKVKRDLERLLRASASWDSPGR